MNRQVSYELGGMIVVDTWGLDWRAWVDVSCGGFCYGETCLSNVCR